MKHLYFLFFCLLSLSIHAQTTTWVDVTSEYIKNPRFDGNSNVGWTISANSMSKSCDQNAQEFWNGTWDIRQTMSLPNGHYRVSVNAFHRPGQNNAQALSNYSQNKENITSMLFANNESKPLKSVYSDYLMENYAWNCYIYSGKNYPNGMISGAYAFSLGKYLNTIEVDVTDGKLTIGIKNSTNNNANWCMMDNWKLELQADVDNSEEAFSHLRINEIQTCNIDQFVDLSFNYGPWIEIYNPNEKAIDIMGCYISDVSDLPKKEKITRSIMIPAQGFICLWFDHHDQYSPSQIGLKPDCEGGVVLLSSPQGNLIDQENYGLIAPRTSMARTADGGSTWGFTSSPTPAASNATSVFASLRLAEPVVSERSGFFTGKKLFSVTIPSGTKLMYTTDGSTPSATNGKQSSSGKFECSATTCYRFCLVSDTKLSSPVVTRTFILNNISHPLPVISVVSDNRNLYSSDMGIFTKGTNGRAGRGQNTKCNWNMEWERPANFEFFDANGTLQVNQETYIERCGGWSRAWTPYSFKVRANKVFESQNFLDYQFFPSKPYLKHKTLQIRNGGNDSWARFKDPALQMIIARSGIYVDWQDYVPVQHFINGKYAGLINMREPNNKHYAYSNYGYDDEELDQFEMSPDSNYVQNCGTDEAFLRWYKLSSTCGTDDKAYEEICQLVDIDEYCNYMAIEFYLGGSDWPQNNVKGFRSRIDGGKFHFVLFDLDGTFATTSPFEKFAGKQNYTFDYLYGIDSSGNDITGKRLKQEIKFVTIFKNMLANTSFRRKFIDCFCLVAGSVFETSRCDAIITELANRVRSAQQISSEVYGDGSSPDGTANDLKAKLKSRASTLISALKSYSPMRLAATSSKFVNLSSNVSGAGILLNDIPVPTGKLSGTVFFPAVIKAVAPAGYKFEGWKSNGKVLSSSEEYKLTGTTTQTIVASYVALDPSEHNIPPVVINEVSASNSVNINDYAKKDDWIELYNTTDKDIDLEGMYLTDNLSKPKKYCITAGSSGASTVIPAHGYKVVWCSKRTTDRELHASFKLDNADNCVVSIMSADGSWSDTMTYGPMLGTESYGRYPDASGVVYQFVRPTILASNSIVASSKVYVPTQSVGIVNLTYGDALKVEVDGDRLVVENASSDVVVTLSTMMGTTVFTTTASASTASLGISLPNLPSAPYVVKVQSGKQKRVLKYLKR